MKLIQQIVQLFATPSADVLAVRELEEAKRQLLLSLSAQEYATSQVRYNQSRVERLTKTTNNICPGENLGITPHFSRD
jgi:hypothetical protein